MGKSRAFVAVMAAGISLAWLLPAQAQFWDWGGRPQRQQQQQYNNNNNWFGGGWRLVRERPALRPASGTRGAGRLFARARLDAEEAGGHHPDRGGGRRHRRLARLRSRRRLRRKARDQHRAQASHRFRPDPLRHAPRYRVAAGGARDHRSRQAQIHRHDGRQQRPSDHPRKGARRRGRPARRTGGAEGRRATAGPAECARGGDNAAGAAGRPRAAADRATRGGRTARQHRRRSRRGRPISVRGNSTPRSGSSPISSASMPPSPRSRARACRCSGSACRRSAVPRPAPMSSYLNELYRSRAEKAGIAYVDIWDGFVDEAGRYSPQGPDFEGQIRRLRTGDGVYFTKFGARKLAHYVEREIQRTINNRGMSVALPVPVDVAPQAPSKPGGPAARPLGRPRAAADGGPHRAGRADRRRARGAGRRHHRHARAHQGRADRRSQRARGRFQLAARRMSRSSRRPTTPTRRPIPPRGPPSRPPNARLARMLLRPPRRRKPSRHRRAVRGRVHLIRTISSARSLAAFGRTGGGGWFALNADRRSRAGSAIGTAQLALSAAASSSPSGICRRRARPGGLRGSPTPRATGRACMSPAANTFGLRARDRTARRL